MKFTTSTNYSFEITIPAHVLTAEQGFILCTAVNLGVAQEDPDKRNAFRSTVVSALNAEFKSQACAHAMLSDDVILSILSGLKYGKLYISKDGDTVVVNYGTAEKMVQDGKNADGSKRMVNRPDWLQFIDVVRFHKRYNAKLKKEGHADGYTMKGNVDPKQFNLLTVFGHNLAGRVSDYDRTLLSQMGDDFAVFAEKSNGKTLKAVAFWYALFNTRTGKNYQPIDFIAKALRKDKRLATFDSIHYTDTVPGEYMLLSVLMSHYINTGVKVIENSKSKKLSGVTATAEKVGDNKPAEK